nr:PadR family transcriptional regulator [Intrasporangium sp.]
MPRSPRPPSRRAALLEFAILGLLHDGALHGYELRKRLTTALGIFRALSYGSLYPALRGLVESGHITETQEPSPAGKRPRITYELTAEGKEHFQDLVAASGPDAWDDDDFDVRFAFFSRTEREVRLRILEGRRSRLEERLARIRETSVRNRERMDSYTLALQQHGEERAEREVRWLEELISAERRAALDPGPAAYDLDLSPPGLRARPPSRPDNKHHDQSHNKE